MIRAVEHKMAADWGCRFPPWILFYSYQPVLQTIFKFSSNFGQIVYKPLALKLDGLVKTIFNTGIEPA